MLPASDTFMDTSSEYSAGGQPKLGRHHGPAGSGPYAVEKRVHVREDFVCRLERPVRG